MTAKSIPAQEPKNGLSPQLESLLEKARELEKWPLARLISVFEGLNEQSVRSRHQLIQYLKKHEAIFPPSAKIIGFTGTPGAGKSSLIGELCLHLLKKYSDLKIAVLAVDPSSQTSGGSILGDRTRVNFPRQEKRLFFRSQASNLELGGVSRQTFQATRLLRYFFDLIFIETVGIGQSEIEVQQVSDHTCLILQPLTGDQIQFMKAGIMEIPDTFIINKCDEKTLAKRSYHLLKSSLKLAQIQPKTSTGDSAPIFMTSALKKTGIEELGNYIIELSKSSNSNNLAIHKELFYLEKWVNEEYGRWGRRIYDELKNSSSFEEDQTYEDRESIIRQEIQSKIK